MAIKCVHDTGCEALLERDLATTFDEADTLSALDHPGIVKTLNRGFGDPARRKRPYLVMEYFAGHTLQAWMKVKGTLPLGHVLRIARQIAEAVHQAHKLGIYHRDIKPANVMARFDKTTGLWYVKVIDFGLAVKVQAARVSVSVPSGQRAAFDRSRAGTLRYNPPEQRNELDAAVGPYSDVYAFGKTCLDLLFGTTEPKSFDWAEVPEAYRKRVQDLLERATVDNLKRRWPNFEPVLAGLAELLGETAAVVAPPEQVRKATLDLPRLLDAPTGPVFQTGAAPATGATQPLTGTPLPPVNQPPLLHDRPNKSVSMIYAPQINPHTFIHFSWEGESCGLRNYALGGMPAPDYSRKTSDVASLIQHEVRYGAGTNRPPVHRLEDWRRITADLNQRHNLAVPGPLPLADQPPASATTGTSHPVNQPALPGGRPNKSVSMIYAPEINPHTFLHFSWEGERCGLRNYTGGGTPPPDYSRRTSDVLPNIQHEVRYGAGTNRPALTKVEEWQRITADLNQQYGIGTFRFGVMGHAPRGSGLLRRQAK